MPYSFSLSRIVVAASLLIAAAVSFVLLPQESKALECTLKDGDIFRVGDDATVYLVVQKPDGTLARRFFHNAEVFHSWFNDYSRLKTITADCFSTTQSDGPVSFRPGAFLIKTTVSSRVYLVLPNYRLRHIANEQVAIALFGTKWANHVRDVSDTLMSFFALDPVIDDTTPLESMVIQKEGSPLLYYVKGNELFEIKNPGKLKAFVIQPDIFAKLTLRTDKAVSAQIIMHDPTQKLGVLEVEKNLIEEEKTKTTDSDASKKSSDETLSPTPSTPKNTSPISPMSEKVDKNGRYVATGSGAYRFNPRIDYSADRSIDCGKPGNIQGSTGTTYDTWYLNGYQQAKDHQSLVPAIKNSTPPAGAKDPTAYKAGYNHYFTGYAPAYKWCPDNIDLSLVDADGWHKLLLDKVPTVTFWTPPRFADDLYIHVEPTPNNKTLAAVSPKYTLHSLTVDWASKPFSASVYNTNKNANLVKMDFIEIDTDPNQTAKEIITMMYNFQVDGIKSSVGTKSVCAISDPEYSDKVVGNNAWSQVRYRVGCKTSSSIVQNEYIYLAFPIDSNTMLLFDITAKNPVSKDDGTVDASKIIDQAFIDQFFGKIVKK